MFSLRQMLAGEGCALSADGRAALCSRPQPQIGCSWAAETTLDEDVQCVAMASGRLSKAALGCRYPLAMQEDANFTGQYAAQLNTNILLPDLAYSNAATLSFCDSVRMSLRHGDHAQR